MSYELWGNTHYFLLITHYFKIKDSWSRGFSEKRGLGLCPSGAISQDKPLPQLNTTCNGWGLKPLNLRSNN
jgi:hypothetical protein